MTGEDDEEKIETLRQKVDYFYKNGVSIHTSYKNGKWKRGFVLEVSSDFFMLDEFLEGKIPVFFLELNEVEKFKEVKNEKN